MTKKYELVLNYIKDLSIEIPNAETLLFSRENFKNYVLGMNIRNKSLKNKMIEVITKLTYKDKNDSEKQSSFEIFYASVIKINNDDLNKEELEKIILCDLQMEIYPKLEKIFLNIIKDSGFPNLKLNKKVDFDESYVNSFSDAFARIECHYFINNIFLEDDFILKNIKEIESIPTKIIQGRYDVVCPVRSAWDLNKKLKNSELIIVNDAGHSMSEKGISIELIKAVKGIQNL